MLLINPDGSGQGPFRIAITGSQLVGRITPIDRLIPEIPPSLAGLHISYYCNRAGVEPPLNSLATPWVDLEDLLRERQATTSNADGASVPNTELLAFLSAQPADKYGVGASLRWAVGAASTSALRLELQALPARAHYLNQCSLTADNSVSVLIGEVPLRCELFNGSDHAGPVPFFFTPDQDASLSLMRADSEPAYQAIAALNARFRHNEHLGPEDALNYVRGKHRPPRGSRAFIHPGPPPSKKPRRDTVSAGPSQETGRYSLFPYLHCLSLYLPLALTARLLLRFSLRRTLCQRTSECRENSQG